MSERDAKRAQVRRKVAASQERLTRESQTASQHQRNASPSSLQGPLSRIKDHPWLTVSAGLAAGVLIGVLFPKRLGGKIAQGAVTLATLATEASRTFGRQAAAVASEAGREGIDKANDFSRHAAEFASEGLAKLDEETAPFRRSAIRMASDAGGNARGAGLAVAREAIRIVSRIRK